MAKRFKYISSLKPETQGGAASVLMALISIGLFIIAVILSYVFQGIGGKYLGVIGFTAMLLSVVGFFIGMHSFSEKDKNHRFSTMGAMANGIITVGWLALFLIGV